MSIFQAILLGIVQGLTEFLPVSSSGHLVLVQNLFGLTDSMVFFDVMLHMGTLVAVFVVFWDEIHKTPPKVIVITNARLVVDNSFAKLEQWPEFVDFLNSNYDLVSDRSMGPRTDVPEPPAYRIYVLKADKQLAQPVS